MAIELHNHEERQPDSIDNTNSADLFRDLVSVPADRRHEARINHSLPGLIIAICVTIPGAAVLGAGYGAFQALCSEHLANIALFCSLPFWISIPAQLGFMWGKLRNPRWRYWVEVLGFGCCLYSIYVGWLFAVLDGPGLVLDPLALMSHAADAAAHGIWVEAVPLIDLRPELPAIEPYLIAARIVEFCWIALAGLMSLGADTPYPWCPSCKRWMDESASLRLKYDAVNTDQVRNLAADLVASEYEHLLEMDQPVEGKDKGLDISVYGCPGCGTAHVMDVRWYRATPDAEHSEVERMLESAAGTQVVSQLKVPAEIHTHIARLADRAAA